MIFFFRPINDDGERVAPSDLTEHCITNGIPQPGCLCTHAHRQLNGPRGLSIKEAQITLMSTGRHRGEYVVACAAGECEYKGVF